MEIISSSFGRSRIFSVSSIVVYSEAESGLKVQVDQSNFEGHFLHLINLKYVLFIFCGNILSKHSNLLILRLRLDNIFCEPFFAQLLYLLYELINLFIL